MRFAGLVKNSFLDFPGCIAAVVFTPGCNMDCWYCHNKHLWGSGEVIETAEIDSFLDTHRGFLDGVVISGGEPTLQEGLEEFVKGVKKKGYRVKLDTNGTKPYIIKKLLPNLDYIAMDIKAPPGCIGRVVSRETDEAQIWETADLIMGSFVDYEFRTTVMPLLDVEDIKKIAARIKGAKRYALQQYRKTEGITPGSPKSKAFWGIDVQPEPHSAEYLKQAAEAVKEYVSEMILRGI